MIRINLLPHRELKRAARRRQFNIMLGIAVAAGVLTRSLCSSAAVDWCRARLPGGKARNVDAAEEHEEVGANRLDRDRPIQQLQGRR